MSPKWLLILFMGICSIPCFATTNYEIIGERAEFTDIDSEVILVTHIIHKYNRTCKALSMNITVLKKLSDATVEIQGYALYSNEYRPVPVVFKRNVCDIYKYEFLWIKSEILKTGNIPTQCPILAGDYYLKDFVPNGADFPAAANFPWTKVMFRLRFFYRNKVFVTVKLYATLDHDAELKRMG